MFNKNQYSKFITVLIIRNLNSATPKVVYKLYMVWVKIDESLPWIELKGEYQNRKEAREHAKQALRNAKIKLVKVADKKKPLKALATAKAVR
jgi:hypothetical protein